MAYSTNPNLPKARATALRMLLVERMTLGVVANRCGVHRTTIWRWKQKWLRINKDRQLTNDNRPMRTPGKERLRTCTWTIPTTSAATPYTPARNPQSYCRPGCWPYARS